MNMRLLLALRIGALPRMLHEFRHGRNRSVSINGHDRETATAIICRYRPFAFGVHRYIAGAPASGGLLVKKSQLSRRFIKGICAYKPATRTLIGRIKEISAWGNGQVGWIIARNRADGCDLTGNGIEAVDIDALAVPVRVRACEQVISLGEARQG